MYSGVNIYTRLSFFMNGLCLHYLQANGDATPNHFAAAWPDSGLLLCVLLIFNVSVMV